MTLSLKTTCDRKLGNTLLPFATFSPRCADSKPVACIYVRNQRLNSCRRLQKPPSCIARRPVVGHTGEHSFCSAIYLLLISALVR